MYFNSITIKYIFKNIIKIYLIPYNIYLPMESLFAFKGLNYVLVAVDPTTKDRIMKLSHNPKHFNTDKISTTFIGEQSDFSRVALFVNEKMHYENKVNYIPITVKTMAKLIQKRVYDSLRKKSLRLSSIVTDGSEIYAVDEYGCLFAEKRIALGYALYFLNGIFDNQWKETISREEGLQIVKNCLKTLKEKFLLNIDELDCRIVTSEGIESLTVKYE